MTDKDLPRLVVTVGLFVLFGYVLWHNTDNEMLIGAMIGALTTATSFWLGSSKGSSDKSEQIERQAEGPTGTKDDPLAVEGADKGSEPVTVRGKSGG